MSFTLSDFIALPSQELLDLANTSDLLDIADLYGLPNVKKTMLNMKLRIFSFSSLWKKKYLILEPHIRLWLPRLILKLRELEIKNQVETKN